MAGIYEHFKARPGNPIPTGAQSSEALDRWKNISCQVCEKKTDTCDEFWDHLRDNHHITSNNVAKFHECVQQLKNHALKPDSTHFIVSITKCAQTLGIINADGFHNDGAHDVTVLRHLDPIGRAIVIQATSDPFFKAILKKVTIHFQENYGPLIRANWDVIKKVKVEIKEEFDVKKENGDQLAEEIKPTEKKRKKEKEKSEQKNEWFQSLSIVKKEPIEIDSKPRAYWCSRARKRSYCQ